MIYEYTILESDSFHRYLEHYHLVDNIICFIEGKGDLCTEKDFLKRLYDNSIEYLEQYKKLVENDKQAVREFINKIYKVIQLYYVEITPKDHAVILSNTNQILSSVNSISEKQDTLFNYLQNGHEPSRAPITSHKSEIRIKKVYSAVPNFINRLVVRLKDIPNCRWFSDKYSKQLLDVCLETKRVVILGEAGSGKSVLLQQLAHEACDTPYYPLLCRLNQYDYNKSIEDLIHNTYPAMYDYSNVFLILDGYDEIADEKRNEFARRLISFSSTNEKTIIVISTRSNFYVAGGENGEESTFVNFQPYEIAPISKESIDVFLHNRGIDSNAYWDEVAQKELTSLVDNPFYLRASIDVFQKEHRLPDKGKAMQEFIEIRLHESMKKYARTQSINIGSVYSTLMILAVAMQLAHLSEIKQTVAESIVTDKSAIEMVIYSGIISMTEAGDLCFDHNNIREYLAAEYLSKIPLKELTVVICSEDHRVLPSYVNTLSYLVQIDSGKVYDYLLQYDPEILIRFEKSRLTQNQRTKIVIDYLNTFSKKHMWLSFGREHPRALASFGQSKDLCVYLLDQIHKPASDRSQHNAIYVLSYFTDLFGLESKTQTVLFDVIKSGYSSISVVNLLYKTLAKLQLDTDEITAYATGAYKQIESASVCMGILNYLLISGRFKNHLDLFFYEALLHRKDDDGYCSFFEILSQLCNSISDIDSLCKALQFFSNNKKWIHTTHSLFEMIIENSIRLFPEHKTKVFNSVFKAMCDGCPDPALLKQCVFFFDSTNTRQRAYIKLYKRSKSIDHALYLLSFVGNENCYSALLKAIVKQPTMIDTNTEHLIDVTSCLLSQNNKLGELYQKELNMRGIKTPETKAVIDYNKAQAEKNLLFLSWLFDYQLLSAALSDFALVFNKLDIKVNEASERFEELINDYGLDYDNYVKRQALIELWMRVLQNLSGNCLIVNSISEDTWNNNYHLFVFDFLSSNESLDLSIEQKADLKDYCCTLLDSVDFKHDITEIGTKFSCAYRLAMLVFFSDKLDLEYDKQVYRKMMSVPCWLFAHNESGQLSIPSYIQKHLSVEEIQTQIKQDLGEVCSSTADMYISYCREKHIDAAVEYAKNYCLNPNKPDPIYSNAIYYLYELKGADYVYDLFLESAEGNLLDAIIVATKSEKNPRLTKCLEEKNKNADDNKRYLAILIELESEYGINRYCEIIRELRCTIGGDNSFFDSPEYAFESISNINLLAIIDEIRRICFSPDFKDLKNISLRGQLNKVYQNMAGSDPERVLASLKIDAIRSDLPNEERGFCNSLIELISPQYHSRREKKWTPLEIKSFLNNHQFF